MTIARTEDDVIRYMTAILSGGIENPVLVDKYMPGVELEVDVISDGEDVLIPGIMEHIERAGIHSGDSIAVYPPYNLSDRFLKKICEVSEKLALALGTQGLVNIQYLIYENELYIIEVNPRASRTVPYISKVTNVPMVDIAARVMLGEKLRDIGYGTGLAPTPPYYAVKVPVFSFEKLSDANSILGPEMKSTGEVLGIGKTMSEALYKGLTAAGFRMPSMIAGERTGILLSVEEHDYQEAIAIAKRFHDLGIDLYSTAGTAEAIRSLGISVRTVDTSKKNWELDNLLESGKINYIVYSGAVKDATMGNFTVLHRRAIQLGIPTLTTLDTAQALTEVIATRFNPFNTELVDINNMRTERQLLRFAKMQSSGNDYIFIDNFDGSVTSPESLCVTLCAPHFGIGANGIVLMEPSDIADAKMRHFNRDGSEGRLAGNNLRCVGKYLYDKGIVTKDTLTVETASGVKTLHLFIRDGRVTSVSVEIGEADLDPRSLPTTLPGDWLINYPISVAGQDWRVSCLSIGSPHCVIFREQIDDLDLQKLGPAFENADFFPDRINTEFVRVVNSTTLRMRVWERANGETLACGTGACAAAVAAVENGYCRKGADITVKMPGGDLIVNYTDDMVTLTGDTVLVFEGQLEY